MSRHLASQVGIKFEHGSRNARKSDQYESTIYQSQTNVINGDLAATPSNEPIKKPEIMVKATTLIEQPPLSQSADQKISRQIVNNIGDN